MATAALRDLARDLLRHGLAAVAGDRQVAAALQRQRWPAAGLPPPAVVAIGKAAPAMAAGALAQLQAVAAVLIITRHGHAAYPCGAAAVECLEAGHPLPDQASLDAGARLQQLLRQLPPATPLLILLSGGSSALIEALPPGVTLADLIRCNRWLLASGADIDTINRVRKRLSLLKGGRLAALIGRRPLLQLVISDVPGDDPRVIGSGPLVAHDTAALALPPALLAQAPRWLLQLLQRGIAPTPAPPLPPPQLIASNATAVAAVAARAAALGWPVTRHPAPFSAPALQLGRCYGEALRSLTAPGVLVAGGESRVRLPAQPGYGGRNQHLALAAAIRLAGWPDRVVLAVGSDGSDGVTGAAGGLVDGATVARAAAAGFAARQTLRRADAGPLLDASGDLVVTGATGTNVMDLVVAIRG